MDQARGVWPPLVPVTLANVAPGVVSATSTQAVNGAQLYGLAQGTPLPSTTQFRLGPPALVVLPLRRRDGDDVLLDPSIERLDRHA